MLMIELYKKLYFYPVIYTCPRMLYAQRKTPTMSIHRRRRKKQEILQ